MVYSAPLPHVLILTAIVVGIATTALGLALIVRIREAYDTIEEVDVLRVDREAELEELREAGMSDAAADETAKRVDMADEAAGERDGRTAGERVGRTAGERVDGAAEVRAS